MPALYARNSVPTHDKSVKVPQRANATHTLRSALPRIRGRFSRRVGAGACANVVMTSRYIQKPTVSFTICVIPARPPDPTGWTGCRYTAGIPGYRRPYRLDFLTQAYWRTQLYS